MLSYQPKSSFGNTLKQEFGSKDWTEAYIASAWVRRSGISALRNDIQAFLENKSKATIVVGVDFNNTTEEGLRALIELSQFGDLSNYVYCNEAGAVFHPKMYLFANATACRLYVGSNNLTGAGLYSNNEAIFGFDASREHPVFQSAISAFSDWTNVPSGVSKQLTPQFLALLLENGYVQSEERARIARIAATEKHGQGAKPLFGSVNFPKPPGYKKPQSKPAPGVPQEATSVQIPAAAKPISSKEFWIETGALTGGSGNQLDLSMVSIHGRIPGSISLFKVNPSKIGITTQIDILYQGINYVGNSIKYPKTVAGKTNGTWRLQMNGVSTDGIKLTAHCSTFRKKILHFREIGDRKFEIAAVDSKSELNELKAKSKEWDTNQGGSGRHFGFL